MVVRAGVPGVAACHAGLEIIQIDHRYPRHEIECAPVNDNVMQEWSTTTFGNDDWLPRLPLPTLEESCERFLASCAPLLTAEQEAVTVAAVEQFLAPDSPARRWHAELVEYDGRPDVHSWLDRFWVSRHRGRRDRIALNANFFFLLRSPRQNQIDCAAGLIASTMQYKLQLDAEAVPPVVSRGHPLSMHQNKFLFSTTRIPGLECDTVRAPYSDEQPGPSTARHIVVFFRGHGFQMEVLDAQGHPRAVQDLAAGLEAVTTMDGGNDEFPGALTTKPRAEWAATRQALLALPGNAAALEVVETALLCVALEDITPDKVLDACDQLLCGDSHNRWYDKALTFIVFQDGRAGVNIEHCGLDGTTVLSFCDTILATADAAGASEQPGRPPAVERIEFTLDDQLKRDVREAAKDFDDQVHDTATAVVTFDDFGSDTAKGFSVSPDAFVQLAYQLAHQRARGLLGTTYESVSMRHYRRGRTEALRAVTPQVVRFVEAMSDPAVGAAERAEALRVAATAHAARAQECRSGRAPERHLAELQWIQRRNSDHPAPLHESPGWLILRDDYLSTSSVPSANIEFFGFGPTTAKCLGIGYVLLPDRFNVYLSAPRAVEPELRRFAEALPTAIADMSALLAPAT